MAMPPKQPTRRRLLVVEPHQVAARHLAALLERNPALEVIVSDVNLAAVAASPNKPSVVVVDGDALPFPLAPFLHSVRAAFCDARLLVIGKRPSDDELCRLLFQGVSGFVGYDEVEQDMAPAVEALLRGHTWFPPQVLERYAMLSSSVRKAVRRVHGNLSAREIEVMGLLQRRLSKRSVISNCAF